MLMAKEIDDLIKRIRAAVTSVKVMRTALTSTMAIHKSRIFENGKAADGSDIGEYSTKPISISRKIQARDTGHTNFPGGYAQYKQEIGKGGKKNYRNTDQMQADYQIIQNGDKFGFGFSNPFNFEKSQWLQDQDDKDVFDLSDRELNVFGDVHKAEVEKLL